MQGFAAFTREGTTQQSGYRHPILGEVRLLMSVRAV